MCDAITALEKPDQVQTVQISQYITGPHVLIDGKELPDILAAESVYSPEGTYITLQFLVRGGADTFATTEDYDADE